MSERKMPSVSPFIISKSILKQPLRDPSASFYSEHKSHNLRLFINKKHSELKEKYGTSSRGHAIAYVSSFLPEAPDVDHERRSPGQPPQKLEDTLDPMMKRILDKMKDQVPKDYFYIESNPLRKPKKKMKVVSRDQALRAYVFGCMKPEIVEKLYGTYKEQQRDFEINKLKAKEKQRKINIKALLESKKNIPEMPESYIIGQMMEKNNINASAIMNVGELKAKMMDNEEPPDERERELDRIFEKHGKTKQSQLLNEEQENAYVINLYKVGSAGTFKASNLQLSRIRGFLDKEENMYDLQEKMMREAREQETRENNARFVREEKHIAKQIEEKSKLNLAKLIIEHRDQRRSLSPEPLIRHNSVPIVDVRLSQTALSPVGERSSSPNASALFKSPDVSQISFRSPVKLRNTVGPQSFQTRSLSEAKILLNTSVTEHDGSPMPKNIAYMGRTTGGLNAFSKVRVNMKNDSSSLTERMHRTSRSTAYNTTFTKTTFINGYGSNNLQSLEELSPRQRGSHPNISQGDNSSLLSITRVGLSQERFLQARRNQSNHGNSGSRTYLNTLTSQRETNTSRKGSFMSHKGSISSTVLKKMDPLYEVKEKFQQFHTKTEEAFVAHDRDKKKLENQVIKAIKETKKNYKNVKRVSENNEDTERDEEILLFHNQRNFRKAMVSKLVDSLEDKQEAIQAIQKKRMKGALEEEMMKGLGTS